MNKELKPLSAEEREDLGKRIEACTAGGGMSIARLDGFLAGLALVPVMVPPGSWLKWVFDAENGQRIPERMPKPELDAIYELIVRMYNEVFTAVDAVVAATQWKPAFDDKQYTSASEWATGAMTAMTDYGTNVLEWLMANRRDDLQPMALLNLPLGDDLPEEERASLALRLRATYLACYAAMAPARVQASNERRRAAARGAVHTTVQQSVASRNEPCPCGSGIKYKKCHGRPV